ncbi:3-beta-hydroxysteroid sulfotransferase-like [Pseudophryne corroboree]|uniref:3-beta-hydroxysteroid sulfotransferase-like n=1 Tax=Pseudophryne corroboree TaxID=495146 RepID=UPI003081D869
MEMTQEYCELEGIKAPFFVHSRESLYYAWKEFQTLDDDVFNVTYPKSGTTWLQDILSLIYSNGDPTPIKTQYSWDRVPWLEQRKSKAQVENLQSPRLITTHLPIQLFPQSFYKTKAKVIYTVRNPKDICVSLYHFSLVAQFMDCREDFQEFVSLFHSKDIIFGRWSEHVKGWLTMKDNPNFLLFSYDEMLKDPKSNIIKLCKFLGKDLDDAAINSVVENSSFQVMKSNDKSNYSMVPDFIFNKSFGSFHRKGISGDHKQYFTPAQEKEFEELSGMKDINLPFLQI